MSRIAIAGLGAVSPAGWSVEDLCVAIENQLELPTKEIKRPGWESTLNVRRTPAPQSPPTYARHARFRRTSPISRFAAAAALEALGDDVALVADGSVRLGVVFCVMAGCVNYSRRFFEEVLKDPATASPLIFPETVFNAPASHLAALLGSNLINYTLVGDDCTFAHGLVAAAEWLNEARVDGCLVIGAEEHDWLTSDAMHLFDPGEILAEGAGAIYLKANSQGPTLRNVASPQVYLDGKSRVSSVQSIRNQLEMNGSSDALFDSLTQNRPRLNPESIIWKDWSGKRISTRRISGNAFNASSAWQCIVAAHQISRREISDAFVTITGVNQEAIGLTLGGPDG